MSAMNKLPTIRKCTRCTHIHWTITDAGRATDVATWAEAMATVNARARARAMAAQRRMALAA